MAKKKITQDRRNYRIHSDRNKTLIKKSLEDCGTGRSILIDKNDEIIAGNGVFEQAEELGIPVKVIETDGKELIAVKRVDLDTEDEKRKQMAIMDNSTTDSSMFDEDLLRADFDIPTINDWGVYLEELSDINIDDFFEEEKPHNKYADYEKGALNKRFLYRPFSVLNTTDAFWQQKKKFWRGLIDSGAGRDDNLIGSGMKALAENSGANLSGTSIFDPVLCEILLYWYSDKGDKILDPFAGGSVRGIISSMTGRNYYGNDLSERQIIANKENWELVKDLPSLYNEKMPTPNWFIGDSKNIDTIISERDFDFLMTCPPYFDLEVYSNDKDDLSNMNYTDFSRAYKEILQKSVSMLKEDAFIAIVVAEVRDKKHKYGGYCDFVMDTIKSFQEVGCCYYNELILVNSFTTAGLRASLQFESSRKAVNTHQKILIFVKGDPKKAKNKMVEYDKEYIQELEKALQEGKDIEEIMEEIG